MNDLGYITIHGRDIQAVRVLESVVRDTRVVVGIYLWEENDSIIVLSVVAA